MYMGTIFVTAVQAIHLIVMNSKEAENSCFKNFYLLTVARCTYDSHFVKKCFVGLPWKNPEMIAFVT